MGSWDFVILVVGMFVTAGALVGGAAAGGKALLDWLRRSGARARGVDIGGLVRTRYGPAPLQRWLGRLREIINGPYHGVSAKTSRPPLDPPARPLSSEPELDGDSGLESLLEPSQQPLAAQPQFNVRFDGEGWRGGALRRGLAARLIFSDLISDLPVFAAFGGSRFAAVVEESEAELSLLLSACPGVMVRRRLGLAQFRAGRLLEDVVFDLDVAASCPDNVTITLQFFSATTLLYGLTLPVVVADAQADACAPILPPQMIDLDARSAQRPDPALPANQLLLSLSLRADGLELALGEYSHGVASAYSSVCLGHLTVLRLQALLDSVHAELGSDFFDAASWDSAEPQPPHLAACLERAASAGSLLYRQLSDHADAVALLERINAQPDGTRLTVATTSVMLPLELLYPGEFNKRWPDSLKRDIPPTAARFWGARFAIEVLHGDGRGHELKQRHRNASRRVSLNIDADITHKDVLSIHESLRQSLQRDGVEAIQAVGCDAMKEVLLQAQTEAAVVYVYCHGAGARAQQGASESLMLDFECEINPDAIVSGSRYPHAPVLILNACNSGTTSPVLFGGFLRAFRRQDALGVISTSFYVPLAFGARFGAELVQICLDRRLPLAENVRRLRHRYALDGNPAPLFYSVQCQLDP